jgi:hypothetical protein
MGLNAKPVIAWDNKLAEATLTASSEATGYPKENVQDWRTYTRWKAKAEKDDDISQTEGSGLGGFGEATGIQRAGQIFKVSQKSNITSAKFKLKTYGSPTDKVKCAIYSTTGSPLVPDAELSVSETEVTPTGDFAVYTFQFNYDADPGDYALVLYRSGSLDDSNHYVYQYNTSDVYAEGHECRDIYESGWSAFTARDFYFEVQFEYPNQWLRIDAGAGNTFAVNSLAISGHDLYTQGTKDIVLQWSDDDSEWTNCHTPFTPSDDKTILESFTEVNHRYFRLLLPPGYASPPQIGVLFMGSYFSFPVYADSGFDPDCQEKEFQAQWSQEGHLLGVVGKYTRRDIPARFRRLPASFISDIFLPFWQEHVPSPFFWAWDITNHPEEVYLVTMAKGKLSMPYAANTRSLELEMVGLKE